jgi:hypothetical protein
VLVVKNQSGVLMESGVIIYQRAKFCQKISFSRENDTLIVNYTAFFHQDSILIFLPLTLNIWRITF